MYEWQIHEKIYEIADGSMTIPILMAAWPMLHKIHNAFPKDVIQLNLTRFIDLFDRNGKMLEDRKKPTSSYWSKANPYPINSIYDDRGILNIYEKSDENCIRLQNLEQIKKLLECRNENPARTILIISSHISVQNDQKKIVWICFAIKHISGNKWSIALE
jgi:hypothetical protein